MSIHLIAGVGVLSFAMGVFYTTILIQATSNEDSNKCLVGTDPIYIMRTVFDIGPDSRIENSFDFR